MAVQATVTVTTEASWTALNSGSAAAGAVSLYHKRGGALYLLVSTSSSPPAFNDASLDDAFVLRPGERLADTTCAKLAPGLTTPQYLYAAPAEGQPGQMMVSTA